MRRFVLPFVLSMYLVPLAKAADQELRTEDFSIELPEVGRPSAGYFPMGFVRGEAWRTVAAGYSQAQEVSMVPGLVHGAAYPAPSMYLDAPWHQRYYSLALPVDSLENLLLSAARAGKTTTAVTKRFGAYTLAHGPDGRPYSLPEFKTRDLAKVRDLIDIFDPATRRYLREYVKAHVESRVRSPLDEKVLRWGLDNEWEAPPNYSPAARKFFLEWLRQAYAGDISGLNAAWRTQFAAFDAKVVADLPTPGDFRTKPGAFLDWYAFSTEAFLQALLEQARTMHETDPQRRGVVHKATQLTHEMPATSRLRLFDHGRFAELVRPYSGGLYGIDMYGAGDRQAYETNYFFNCIRPEDRAPGYGVMLAETNNHGGPGHQFASTSWRLLANGAKSLMYFTPGFIGAPVGSDWDEFAMVDRATGRPRDKWFYAARWAATVHRSEKFWSEAMPAAGLPRLAMLVPKRDILLSEQSKRNPAEGRYAYPRNHRWMVYRWLREQGYWVDVLPYEKLTDRYLQEYAGLVLVGAEHLTGTECETVARYVAGGGVLVGDTLPGYFDQHHRVIEAFARPAGVRMQRSDDAREVVFETQGRKAVGVSSYTAEPVTAQVLARDGGGKPLVTLQDFHAGWILLLPFELGSLVLRGEKGAVASAQSDHAPTAGAEQYDAHAGEFLIGEWLAGLLVQAGLKPAYSASYPTRDAARIVRVEQPSVDAAGNVAVVIGNRAQLNPQERLPVGSVEMPLPGGPWTNAWWASAENETLVAVKVEMLADNRHRLQLPEIPTAGILYLFRHHAPILGVNRIAAGAPNAEGRAPRVMPGREFPLTVQIANTTGGNLSAGMVTPKVPAGWSVVPASAATPALGANDSAEVEFVVTPAADGATIMPDQLYPFVARWSDGASDRAVITAQLEAAVDEEKALRLLTDNTNYPDAYPHRTLTGATYRHISPAAAQIADPASATQGGGGGALTNGFGSIGGERNSSNRGGYLKKNYVKYAAPEAEVVFDLKTPRMVRRVVVVAGPEPVALRRVEVFTSDDGVSFIQRREMTFVRPTEEIAVDLDGVSARYVKLRSEWPTAGGTLDEVEIWGR